MKYRTILTPSQIRRTATEQGESIEEMLRRITANNEPIPAAPGFTEIYTPKDEDVNPDHDIRTDRFDAAIMATDKFAMSQRAKSDNSGVQQQQETKVEPQNQNE